jgi:hypothetical protein
VYQKVTGGSKKPVAFFYGETFSFVGGAGCKRESNMVWTGITARSLFMAKKQEKRRWAIMEIAERFICLLHG